MKKKLIIFGAGKIAQAVSFFFNRDGDYEIAGYCCDSQYINGDSYLGKRLVSSDEVENIFPPSDYEMFVAVGYQGINDFRAKKYDWAIEKGYNLASYRSQSVSGDYQIGQNTMVMDGVIIQPCVKIGDNVLVWGGAMIGHHAVIGNHCWLTGSCAIGGLVRLGEKCFVGLNATVGNEVEVGARCMLGANSLVNKSLKDDSVLVERDTELHRLNSSQFARMSQCFRV